MNWKTWLLLFLALVAGTAASYAVKSAFFVDKGEQASVDSDSTGPKERLLVANGDLAAGSELNASNVRLVLTPEKDVPRDGIFSFSEFAGRKTTREFKDGEPISLYDVEAIEKASEEENAFVPPGYSVVPIEINTASKVNGSRNYLKTMKLGEIVAADSLVDIVVVKEEFSVQTNGQGIQRRRLTTSTIVKGASVFAIDDVNRLSNDGAVRTSILSLLLNTEELELVRKASDEGKIKLILNNEEETIFEGGLVDGELNGLGTQNNNVFRLEDNRVTAGLDRQDARPADIAELSPNFNTGFQIVTDEEAQAAPAIGRKENVSLTQSLDNSVNEEEGVSDFIEGLDEVVEEGVPDDQLNDLGSSGDLINNEFQIAEEADVTDNEPILEDAGNEELSGEQSLNKEPTPDDSSILVEESAPADSSVLAAEPVLEENNDDPKDAKVEMFRERRVNGVKKVESSNNVKDGSGDVNEENNIGTKTAVPTGTVKLLPSRVKDSDSTPEVTPAIKSPFVTKQTTGTRRSRKDI